MICISIVDNQVDSIIKKANDAESDLVELRLDYLEDMSEIEKIACIKKKKIISCMPVWEGGRFEGDEVARIDILRRTLPFSDFITIELNTPAGLRDALICDAAKYGVKSIVSFHDFTKTPSEDEVMSIIKKELACGGDIAKVAFMAKSYGDALSLMQILVRESAKHDIIAISMGGKGKFTRVLGPALGSFLTYAAASGDEETAPGQLTFDEINKIWEIMR